MSVFKVSSNKSSQNQYPSVRPTLDLDFANSKTLDPRITFTRASGGSYVGADGLIKYAGVNEARFDHDPYTGESLGFLVEESRTNLLTYSEQLDNVVWRKVNITATANAGLAPDGTTTAELLTTASTTAVKYFDPLPPPVLQTSSDYCVSFFVKLISGTGGAALVSINSSSNLISPPYASYGLRLDNFAESTGGILPSGRGYTIFPNGWVRMYMVFNTSTQTNGAIDFRVGTNNTVSSYHVWGFQIEKGSLPTSYIPTTTATVTRAADNASITGANFSSWYRNSSSTFALRGKIVSRPIALNTFGILAVSIAGSHADNNFRMRIVGAQFATKRFDNGSGFEFNLPGSVTAGSVYNYAVGYDDTGHAASSPLGFNSTTYPALPFQTPTVLKFVPDAYGASHVISRLTYWPKRLTNAQLQALTR